MDQSKSFQSNFPLRGEIKLTFRDENGERVLSQKNFTLNLALDTVADLLLTPPTDPPVGYIYRMGLGSGGADSFGNRIYPDDTWHTKTSMTSGVYSKDLDGPAVRAVSSNTVSLEFACTFNSDDLIGQAIPPLKVSEIMLIFGKNTSGDQFYASLMGIDDRAFAYRTFDEQQFDPGASTEIEAKWTIFIEKV